MNLKERIEEMRLAQLSADLNSDLRQQAALRHASELQERFNTEVLPFLRKATARDYALWLSGYMAQGGEPTNYYAYKLPSYFYVALADVTLMPLYGSQSVSIIVPVGLHVSSPNGLGHNGIFWMSGYDAADGGRVPVYEGLVDHL